LAILSGSLYVPFGGHFGDCGQYHGVVVSISLSDPRTIRSWATRARGSGIWACDADLGGTNALPFDLSSNGRQPVTLSLGKDRKAYLLDRNDLGGIGGQLVTETVSERATITAPASYPGADGVFVTFQAQGTQCPAEARGLGLVALKIRAGSPPGITTAWCA
jgi:hypothetical protein